MPGIFAGVGVQQGVIVQVLGVYERAALHQIGAAHWSELLVKKCFLHNVLRPIGATSPNGYSDIITWEFDRRIRGAEVDINVRMACLKSRQAGHEPAHAEGRNARYD